MDNISTSIQLWVAYWRNVTILLMQVMEFIDGTVWLDNPIHSSYPPSRVFKLIQTYDEQLANTF